MRNMRKNAICAGYAAALFVLAMGFGAQRAVCLAVWGTGNVSPQKAIGVSARLRWITISVHSLADTQAFFEKLGMRPSVVTRVGIIAGKSLLVSGSTRVAILEGSTNMAGLRLVETGNGGNEIRSRATVSDFGFFDVAFAAGDTARVRDDLMQGGYSCKSVVAYDVPSSQSLQIRESLCLAPDAVNVVFLQRVPPDRELRGVNGILSSVRTVKNVSASLACYRALGFEIVSDNAYDNDAVRQIVDLASGGRLRIIMLASANRIGARIILFQVVDALGRQIPGHDLAERESPPNRGVYLWTFELPDLDTGIAALTKCGATVLTKATRTSVAPYNGEKAATLQLPDGARVELVESGQLSSRIE